MYAIKTRGLTKRYGNITAVDGLDLEIREGELFALLGVNGAGKTTTVKMLTCLTLPSEGDALVGGYSIKNESDNVKPLIGVSPQETAIAPGLTVKENLELMCGIYGFCPEKTQRSIKNIADALGLDVLARRELWDVIRALKGKITIILTTHYMEEAQALSDRIGIMKDGKLLAVGSADELMALAGEKNFEQAFISIVRGMEI